MRYQIQSGINAIGRFEQVDNGDISPQEIADSLNKKLGDSLGPFNEVVTSKIEVEGTQVDELIVPVRDNSAANIARVHSSLHALLSSTEESF